MPAAELRGIHERRQARFGPSLIQGGEVLKRHVDLAAHLHQRGSVGDPQRDRTDRPQVVRHVLADLPVAAGGTALEHAVAVDEADRQPVDLGLDRELEAGIGDALAREMVAHALDPGAQLVLGAHIPQRQHRLQMLDLLKAPDRLAADPLGGRVRGDELWMLALDRAQLIEQRVVLAIADLGVIEDVVATGMVFELGSKLARTSDHVGRCFGLRGAHEGSWTIGASSCARSKRLSASRLGRSVRSKWIGVTATRPAAMAARSVPGSS